MALKPDETGKLNSDELQKVDRVEKAIDEQLRKQKIEGGKISGVVLVTFLTKLENEELQSRYKKSGWNKVNIKPGENGKGDGPGGYIFFHLEK